MGLPYSKFGPQDMQIGWPYSKILPVGQENSLTKFSAQGRKKRAGRTAKFSPQGRRKSLTSRKIQLTGHKIINLANINHMKSKLKTEFHKLFADF